jgi:hypothetical protein
MHLANGPGKTNHFRAWSDTMRIITASRLGMLTCCLVGLGCSPSNEPQDGGVDAGLVAGVDAGGPVLGNNPSVPQTCQACLSQSSGNDCSAQRQTCARDSFCGSLNTCINNCVNVNAACLANCQNAVSVNAGSEWTNWFSCTCADCSAQCGATFCGINDAGCTPDGTTSTQNNCSDCCTGQGSCDSSGTCCVASGSASQNANCSDCCSGSGNCNNQGTCQ